MFQYIDEGAGRRIDMKRKDTLIAVELAGNLRLGPRSSEVIVKDLSADGAMIEVSKAFPYGVVLTLQIDGVGEFEAEQIWWSKDNRLGLRFCDVHEDIYDSLLKVLVQRRAA